MEAKVTGEVGIGLHADIKRSPKQLEACGYTDFFRSK